MSNNTYEYETTDLYLAAALIAAGIKLVRIGRDNPRRAVFVFDDSDELRTYEREHWADELFVTSTRHGAAIKQLKAMLYS